MTKELRRLIFDALHVTVLVIVILGLAEFFWGQGGWIMAMSTFLRK